MSAVLAFLLSQPWIVWATAGVALLIVEVLLTNGFFLSFAAASFILALAHAVGLAPNTLIWDVALMLAIGLALVPVCRAALRRYVDRTPDINDY